MDVLQEIKERLRDNASHGETPGLDSVLTHIEIAERHHIRAKKDRDEHLYTDVIYRTNHAYEGILKEAYVTLAEKSASKLTPEKIEEYLLGSNALKNRVADLLRNSRQNWRNPSTHDHQLFFSEQESFLAIITVSAFVSILLDQILEKLAYKRKFDELEHAAKLAREKITDFDTLRSIDKVSKILLSFTSHYITNFHSMSKHPRSIANAQMAAFIKSVAPSLSVEIEPEVANVQGGARFDLIVKDGSSEVVVETRQPRPRDFYESPTDDQAAIGQLVKKLRTSGKHDGVLFFYPGRPDDVAVTTTDCSGWPDDLGLREVFSDDPNNYDDFERDEAVPLVTEG